MSGSVCSAIVLQHQGVLLLLKQGEDPDRVHHPGGEQPPGVGIVDLVVLELLVHSRFL